jgi:hypothetical protein
MRTITPSIHYSIRVPHDVRQQQDEEVLSLWREENSRVLQFSSRFRGSGQQVSAGERLADRIAKGGSCSEVEIKCAADCDVAAAQMTDGDVVWWHIYLVTPKLAIYATISFPIDSEAFQWAVDAVGSIRFGDPVIVPI